MATLRFVLAVLLVTIMSANTTEGEPMSSADEQQPTGEEDIRCVVESLRDDVRDVRAENELLRERVEELEAENESLREDLESEKETREELELLVEHKHSNQIERVFTALFGSMEMADVQLEAIDEWDGVIDRLRAIKTTPELQEKVSDLEEHTGMEDAKLNRRIQTLADAVDVELEDADVAGEDKIQRLLKHGPEDVADRVYAVHHRARDLLANAGSAGEKTEDKFGTRIVISGDAAKEKLSDVRNEDLTSGQVRRVFEKLEELAADSPRKVKARTGDTKRDGHKNSLVIYLNQEDLN